MNKGDKIGRTLWLEARDAEIYDSGQDEARKEYEDELIAAKVSLDKAMSAARHYNDDQEKMLKTVYESAVHNAAYLPRAENMVLMADARRAFRIAMRELRETTEAAMKTARQEYEARCQEVVAMHLAALRELSPLVMPKGKAEAPKSQREALKIKHAEDTREYRLAKMQEREEQMVVKKELARQKAEEQLRKARAGHLTPKELRLRAASAEQKRMLEQVPTTVAILVEDGIGKH